MRTNLVRPGQIVQFKHGNGVHTGTVKTVGRNGDDEVGSEVVIGDIYPHLYDQPTVTKHGLDLLSATGPNQFPQVSNQPLRNQDQQRAEGERERLNRLRNEGARVDQFGNRLPNDGLAGDRFDNRFDNRLNEGVGRDQFGNLNSPNPVGTAVQNSPATVGAVGNVDQFGNPIPAVGPVG